MIVDHAPNHIIDFGDLIHAPRVGEEQDRQITGMIHGTGGEWIDGGGASEPACGCMVTSGAGARKARSDSWHVG